MACTQLQSVPLGLRDPQGSNTFGGHRSQVILGIPAMAPKRGSTKKALHGDAESEDSVECVTDLTFRPPALCLQAYTLFMKVIGTT